VSLPSTFSTQRYAETRDCDAAPNSPSVEFRAQGECMYQRDWSRERVSADEETEHKTLFGLFFTLKDFAKQLDPLGYALAGDRVRSAYQD